MKRIAIACQGGGSHTAFTAGVLRKLLTSQEFWKNHEITALTGTSGGALCAALAWSRLLDGSGPKQAKAAADALRDFWIDLSCDDEIFFAPWRGGPFDYMDAFSNRVMTTFMRANPFAEQDCRLVSRIARKRMLTLLERHLPVGLLEQQDLAKPRLRVGATNILEGYSEPIFVEQHPAGEIHEILLASASIPPLFQPTVLDGAFFWDGLYSHNPPIDCLTNDDHNGPVAEEIWVIQINPETRRTPPATPAELVDRRNELTGNLSLAAELYHIDAMNWAISKVPAMKKVGYREIKLRVVGLREELDFASKYDRSRAQVESLMRIGERDAEQFFHDEQSLWHTETSGVHTAAVDPKRTGRTSRPGKATEAFPVLCTSACPGLPVCNTCPVVGPAVEEAFDIGQRYFEARQ